MSVLLSWGHLMLLLILISLPTFLLLYSPKTINGGLIETFVKSHLIGFFQYFLISLALFYCGLPVNIGGWIISYVVNIGVTALFMKRANTNINPTDYIKPNKVFWVYMGIAIVLLLAFLFQSVRETEIIGDSQQVWFFKGWTFANTNDLYSFRFLFAPTYPLLIPIVYSFFIQFDCVLGVGAYAPLLVISATLLTMINGWKKIGEMSILIGLPLCVFLPIHFTERMYWSYADVPLAICYYVSLLFLMEFLFSGKPVYPAVITLCALIFIKMNGNFMMIATMIVTFVYLITQYDSWRSRLILFFKIFALPLVAILFTNFVYQSNHVPGLTNGSIHNLLNEISNSNNGAIYLFSKIKLILLHYYSIGTSEPSSYIYIFVLMISCLACFLSKSNRIIIFTIMLNLFIVLFVYSVQLPIKDLEDQLLWGYYGYNRIFFAFVPTIMWLLFNIGIDSMLDIHNHYYNNKPNRL